MKFVLTGQPCIDDIRSADGGRIRSWGGVFYTLAAMQHCARIDDRIVPVSPIGAADETEFRRRIVDYTHVDHDGIYPVDARTNTLELVYKANGTRDEHCACVLPPLEFETIKPHLAGAHFVFVNMVSGHDMTLDTLRQIRLAGRRPHIFIYLDVHALVLGDLVAKGPRKYRSVANWSDWMMNVDGLQMNEDEVKYFGGSEKALADNAAMFRNIQVINITRGAKGTSVYGRDTNGEPINSVFSRVDIPPVTLGAAVDETGCGDVFGGAFVMYFAYTRHAILAAQFASYVAAANSTLAGANNIDRLREFVGQYPVFP